MSDKPASRTRGAKRRRDDTESLRQDYECPVCMDLPSGAVHRCAKGHRICGACDERLESLGERDRLLGRRLLLVDPAHARREDGPRPPGAVAAGCRCPRGTRTDRSFFDCAFIC